MCTIIFGISKRLKYFYSQIKILLYLVLYPIDKRFRPTPAPDRYNADPLSDAKPFFSYLNFYQNHVSVMWNVLAVSNRLDRTQFFEELKIWERKSPEKFSKISGLRDLQKNRNFNKRKHQNIKIVLKISVKVSGLRD